MSFGGPSIPEQIEAAKQKEREEKRRIKQNQLDEEARSLEQESALKAAGAKRDFSISNQDKLRKKKKKSFIIDGPASQEKPNSLGNTIGL